jgi:hypothetical protein
MLKVLQWYLLPRHPQTCFDGKLAVGDLFLFFAEVCLKIFKGDLAHLQ